MIDCPTVSLPMRHQFRWLALPMFFLLIGISTVSAQTPTVPQENGESELDPLAQPTAVVLNYCRASFHRIQSTPSKRVLLEEQEKILNNLNLNPIADGEIIRLYTAVLSEIADVQIAERERQVIRTSHNRAVLKDAAISALAIGGQVATTQYMNALRTGANSWWDYRTKVLDRELELWRVEKDRMIDFVDKSSLFLDTFWKLARKRGIADQWLIRGNDLDQLAAAMEEPRLDVRLRVLRRMERFMQCYPPYWYYLARTQQGLGQFSEALETYRNLGSLGDQYFRKDEMLAAAFANQALIEDSLGDKSAVETARKALEYSTEAWEVNLTCGVLLLKHGHVAEAEDAILRNLDVHLESRQSLVALLAVYQVSGDTRKLVTRLQKPEIASSLPAPLLLECAGVLGSDKVPAAVIAHLVGTLRADFDHHFGPDDLRIRGTSHWQLDRGKVSLKISGRTLDNPSVLRDSEEHKLRFSRILELGSPLQPNTRPNTICLTVSYPETADVKLYLQEVSSRMRNAILRSDEPSIRWPLLADRDYRIVALDVRGKRVELLKPISPLPLPVSKAAPISVAPVNLPVDQPARFPVDETELPVVPAF